MSDYQLTATDEVVIRNADGANIPNAADNADRIEYERWLADGGVPDPYVEPEPAPPAPTVEQQILFDHENRILVMEGEPPLSIGDFLAKIGGGA